METKTLDTLLREASAFTQEPLEIPPLPAQAQPPQVVLIGQPQQHLFGVLNKIFGRLDELNGMMFRSFYCTFDYGEETKFFAEVDGTLIETNAESLMQMLLDMDAATPALRCKIEINWSVLQKIQLSIAASGYDYEDFDTLEILSAHDFYLFTLTATTLFSSCEKTFLKEILKPNVTNAMAFVVTNANLILEQDRVDVDEKLKNFLPEGVPIFFVPDGDEDKLAAEIERQSEEFQSLRDKRQARVQKILLNKALAAINLKIEALTLSSESVDSIIERLTAKTKELPKRQESIYRRARTTYLLKIQMDAVERLTAFNQQMLDKVRDEIKQGEDINEMRDVLPNYIRDMWKSETEAVQAEVYSLLQTLQNDLEGMIEKSLREFLNGDEATENIDFDIAAATYTYNGNDATHCIRPNNFNADGADFLPTQVEENSQIKRYGVIAVGMALALASHPIVGATVAIFGSRSIKQDQDARFLAESKDALLVAAKNMTNDLYDEACRWINEGLAQMEKNLSDCIAATCQNVMHNLFEALNARKQDSSYSAQQLDKLKDLKSQLETALCD